ncbi:MAG: sialidase family protein [Thermoplasmatota archaeon]
MGRLLVVVALFLLASGGLAVALVGPDPGSAELAALAAPTPWRLASDLGVAEEPHIAVRDAPGGPVVVVANMDTVPSDSPVAALGTQIVVHRSLDGGASWTSQPLPGHVFEPFDPLGRAWGAGDPVLVYGPDGTLYLAGVAAVSIQAVNVPDTLRWDILVELTVFITRSDDDGATWEPAFHWQSGVGPLQAVAQDKEWLAVGPDGTLHFAWTRFIGLLHTTIYYQRSSDDGATWTEPAVIATPAADDLKTVTAASIAAPGADLVYFSYTLIPPFSPDQAQVVQTSRDGGATWSAPVAVGPAQFPTRMGHVAADPSDPLHAVVSGSGPGDGSRVWISETHDGGTTWSPTTYLAPGRSGTQQHAAPWIDGDGTVHVGFYDKGWDPAGETFVIATLDAGGVVEQAADTVIDPGIYRREYVGVTGLGGDVWAAWVGGTEATGTHIEVGRFPVGN